VNPDAPRIVKIRRNALPKSETVVESKKVLSLRHLLSVPKIDTNSSSDVDTVAKSFDEAIQLTTEEKRDHGNPVNSEYKHDIIHTNNREEVKEGNVLKDDINTETLHKKEEVHKEETSSPLGVIKQEEEEVAEKEKKVAEVEVEVEIITEAEAVHQTEAPVEVTSSSIGAADEEVEVKETKVTEDTDKEAVKEEQSLSVSQEENVTKNEDVESDDESDSSSDSESSSSSSSSSSDSENDDRDDVGRKRLDQLKQCQTTEEVSQVVAGWRAQFEETFKQSQ